MLTVKIDEKRKQTFKDVNVGDIFEADGLYWLRISETNVDSEIYKYEMANVVTISTGSGYYTEHFFDNDTVDRIFRDSVLSLA